MKKKGFLCWILPGFTLWLVFSLFYSRMYEQGLVAGKFGAHADAVPKLVWSMVALGFFVQAFSTALVYGIWRLYRKFWPRHALWGTAGSVAFVALAFWFPYQERTYARNLADISRDVGFELPAISETLMYRSPWRLSLDDHSCSILYIPSRELEQLQDELDHDEGWTGPVDPPEAEWESCLARAEGFHFRAYRTREENVETRILMGFEPSKQLLFHAYSSRLLSP